MKRFAIVCVQTLAVHTEYEAESSRQSEFLCALGDPSKFAHVEIPDDLGEVPHYMLRGEMSDDGMRLVLKTAEYDQWKQQVEADAWDQLRAERNRLLAASDWTVLPDAPLSDAVRAAWLAYRQALRDIPETIEDPFNVAWPTTP